MIDRTNNKSIRAAYGNALVTVGKENENVVVLDADVAKSTDNVDDTVSYAKIIKTARAVFTERSYDLIEVAANKVGVEIMNTYPKLQQVTVLLMKPEAPIKADFDYVAVEETITREDMEKLK